MIADANHARADKRVHLQIVGQQFSNTLISRRFPTLDDCQSPAAAARDSFTAPSAYTEVLPMPQPPGRVEPVPMMQRILDNPFLLLFLGVTIPTVLYILWGVMEVASIPLAK